MSIESEIERLLVGGEQEDVRVPTYLKRGSQSKSGSLLLVGRLDVAERVLRDLS